MHKIYKISDNYTEYPGLRYCNLSEYSGEEFYHTVLNKLFASAITEGFKLTIDLDDGEGYAPSFIDEAFGNLVFDFGKNVVESKLEINSREEPYWINYIMEQVLRLWEKRRVDNSKPQITKKHDPWYRFINNELILKEWILVE